MTTRAASRLRIIQREGIAQLTFAHPASRNGLDLAAMRAFEDGRRAGRPG